MQLDLNAATVGQHVAVDTTLYSSWGNHPSFIFGSVTKVGKSQVTVETSNRTMKFSKATGSPLQAESWQKKYRLVTADHANATLARYDAQVQARKQRSDVRDEMEAALKGEWTKETVAKVRELADRIEKWVE